MNNNNRYFVCKYFSVFLMLFANMFLSAYAQQSPKYTAPKALAEPINTHLTGHEDAALLAKIKSLIDSWDPRRLENPYMKQMDVQQSNDTVTRKKVVRRPDLLEFIADADVAVALGKAFFWEMQAGSDFKRVTSNGNTIYQGTACASCHYRNGTDARNRHTSRTPWVAWDKYKIDNEHPAAANPERPNFSQSEFVQRPFKPNLDADKAIQDVALVVGSQGVEPLIFDKMNMDPPANGPWNSEIYTPRTPQIITDVGLPEWSMFIEGHSTNGRPFRQITNRNSPTVINAVFSDRLFHDGRAESTFNGFSIFGDHDKRQVLFRTAADGALIPVHIAISQAALASQAVGPIVNEVEMSYLGRTFPDVAEKLLDQPWLKYQTVSDSDSVLNHTTLYRADKSHLTYRELIRLAFRPDWWRDPFDGTSPDKVPLTLRSDDKFPEDKRFGTIMEANFPLYWGLSIMLYESTLISDQSPFDAMMRGNGEPVREKWNNFHEILSPVFSDRAGANPPELTTGTAVFQLGMRTFLNRGCVECHEGPLFSSASIWDLPRDVKPAIAHTLDNILLPDAHAASIALNLQQFRSEVDAKIVAQLNKLQIPARDHASLLLVLWRQLEYAHGDVTNLAEQVEIVLPPSQATPESRQVSVNMISTNLMTYEKLASTRTGGRPFFSEDQRIALVEELVKKVFIEKRRIPAGYRPRLPIAGLLASQNYTFYDKGFYNIGVSPPRLDRGVGGMSRELFRLQLQNPDFNYSYLEGLQAMSGARGRAYMLPFTSATSLVNLDRPNDQIMANNDQAITDISWDRNEFPPNTDRDPLNYNYRRSEVHFFSRSRRLVFNEKPVGFRKPFLHDNELEFWGSFRSPTLRNVEITAPYMHNGRIFDLSDVIEFYDQGGFVRHHPLKNPDLHPEMVPLDLTESESRALQFFLVCLTDPRVPLAKAPFDHPSLVISNGYQNDPNGQIGSENLFELEAVGANGMQTPKPTFPADR